jgi:FMN reductase [NAD(P)H]
MFKLPKGVFPVVLLCMGYPTKISKPRNKLGTKVVVHSGSYREMQDQELVDAFNEKYRGEKVGIAEERLETIMKVCRQVHGEEFAKKCADRIKANGYVNRAQHYFGLHYRADLMPEGNDNYLRLMEESGFKWFKKYQSPFAAKESTKKVRPTGKPTRNC